MNSRELAEAIWKTVENAYTYAHEQDAGPEPEDKEGAIQEIEGLLERHGKVPPDEKLKAERAKNETYFP